MRPDTGAADFAGFVRAHRAAGRLVVQPRMGFGSPAKMRAGLLAVKAADACTVGTVTLDSFTRVGDHAGAGAALARGHELNGYPSVHHGIRTTREMVRGVREAEFPVQVRHGTALPSRLFANLVASGLTATEGGPLSYCLPYSRRPLSEAVADWRTACELLAGAEGAHLETFGGCLLGQLCPPSLLVAVSVLECLFFRQHGVRSVSLSYAQQTSPAQDAEAVGALRRLARRHLGERDWHIVIYTYMGMYPASRTGALRLLDESVRLAVETGAERLIVKTAAEARRIPTIADNVAALERAGRTAEALLRDRPEESPPDGGDNETYREAEILVSAVLAMSDDVGTALIRSVRSGLLDVPYCLHPDNRNRTRAYIDPTGRLCWANVGGMPIRPETAAAGRAELGSADFLRMLNYMRWKFDTSDKTEVDLVGTAP